VKAGSVHDAVTSRTTSEAKGDVVSQLSSDLRQILRSVTKAPSLTLLLVVTLGLGIGANSAIFSLIDRVALRPLLFELSPNDPAALAFAALAVAAVTLLAGLLPARRAAHLDSAVALREE